MADALKTFFNPALVRRLAGDIGRVYPEFDSRGFTRAATRGLDDLELLDRGRHIAAALASCLPPNYPAAIDILLASLGPVQATDGLADVGMAPFLYLPHTIFVAEQGLEHFELSMKAQYELTRRFTAEFSIRAFIQRHPERTLRRLRTWASDGDPRVRRLVSEGTRLRLPWGMRVRWLDDNPARVLELLERLKDDPSPLVRRSVANNLNDLGKVHPSLLIRTAQRWLEDAPADRRSLVEHALRSAIKRAEPGALGLLGYGRAPEVKIEKVAFSPRRATIGSRVTVTFTIRSTSRQRQDLLVDMAVHFVKARGVSAKVFKLKRVQLSPRGHVDLRTGISLKVHTTRKPRPGRHRVDVLINGSAMPLGGFDVTAA